MTEPRRIDFIEATATEKIDALRELVAALERDNASLRMTNTRLQGFVDNLCPEGQRDKAEDLRYWQGEYLHAYDKLAEVGELQAVVDKLWSHPSIRAEFDCVDMPDGELTRDAVELRDVLAGLKAAAKAKGEA